MVFTLAHPSEGTVPQEILLTSFQLVTHLFKYLELILNRSNAQGHSGQPLFPVESGIHRQARRSIIQRH